MRKKPSSPYTFLVEFNKNAQLQDGKYKAQYSMQWSQQFQQFTPFKIPKRFEEQHHMKHADNTNDTMTNNQKQSILSLNQKPIQMIEQFESPKRKQFSMTRYQMKQLQNNQVCLGSFDRKNYTLNKILSTFSLEKLNKVYEEKRNGIEQIISQSKQNQNRKLLPKYNRKYDSVIGRMFGTVKTQNSTYSKCEHPQIRIKTLTNS